MAVSDQSLFTVAPNESEEWIVTALRAFSTTEWMEVTIGGRVYRIIVTDAMAEITYIKYTLSNNVPVASTVTTSNYTLITSSMSTVEYNMPLSRDDKQQVIKLEANTTYVVNQSVTIDKPIIVNGKNVNLILCDGKKLTASRGIGVYSGTSLYIYGQSNSTGELAARWNTGTGNGYYSGIGGGRWTSMDTVKDCGTIHIHGGKITANGDEYSEAIGGKNAYIYIYSGTVTASGEEGNNSTNTNGGTALGGESATINIYGGTVTATGGNTKSGASSSKYGGAGIGGKSATVAIFNGTVIANGAAGGAGIGAGGDATTGIKSVTIKGGDVTANGGAGCAGIGGRTDTAGGSVTIEGGTVIATGGTDGAGIGPITNSIKISGATVTASGDGSGVGIGLVGGSSGSIEITDGVVTASGSVGIDGADRTITLNYTNAQTGASVESNSYAGTVTLVKNYRNDSSGDFISRGSYTSAGDDGGHYTLASLAGVKLVPVSINYKDEAGEVTSYTGTISTLSAGDTSIGYGGWYLVEEDLDLTNRISVHGATGANLIICDGATLTMPKGCDLDGYYRPTLNIYAGSYSTTIAGTGKIVAGNADNTNQSALGGPGVLNICDIHVEATSTGGGAALGGDGCNVTVNRADVEATGNNGGVAIGCSRYNDGSYSYYYGSFTMNSGKVNAVSNNTDATIGGSNGTNMAITINGGTVNVRNTGTSGAAIGSQGFASMMITINGGTVHASTTGGGAAIGGTAYYSNCGEIKITGGTVYANYAENENNTSRGAGIGNGFSSGSGGTIEITGGTVYAGGNYSAAIGAANSRNNVSSIKIGGTANVTARTESGSNGAAIGNSSSIEISGGKVQATSNGLGAAIGGNCGVSGKTIVISGGDVTATANGANSGDYYGGVSICGNSDSSQSITISGGTVVANGSGDYRGVIGSNYSNNSATIKLTYSENTSPSVTAVRYMKSSTDSATVNLEYGFKASDGSSGPWVGDVSGDDIGGKTIIPARYGVTVTAPTNGSMAVDNANPGFGQKVTLTTTPADGYAVNGLPVVTYGEGDDAVNVAVTEAGVNRYTFTMPAADVTASVAFATARTVKVESYANGAVTMDGHTEVTYVVGATVTLTVAPDKYYKLVADSLKYKSTDISTNKSVTLTVEDLESHATGESFTVSFAMPEYDITIEAAFEKPSIAVSYRDESDVLVENQAAYPLNGNETTLGAGPTEQVPNPVSWYVVEDNVTFDHAIELIGDVRLILTDGKTMTVDGGSNVFDVSGEDYSLTIYGQSEQSGTLSLNNADSHNTNLYRGKLSIYGGNIQGTTTILPDKLTMVRGSLTAASIGANGSNATLSISGGTVNADIYGVGGVVITGGQVTATGTAGKIESTGGDITLGWTALTDFIQTTNGFAVSSGKHKQVRENQYFWNGSAYCYGTSFNGPTGKLTPATVFTGDKYRHVVPVVNGVVNYQPVKDDVVTLRVYSTYKNDMNGYSLFESLTVRDADGAAVATADWKDDRDIRLGYTFTMPESAYVAVNAVYNGFVSNQDYFHWQTASGSTESRRVDSDNVEVLSTDPTQSNTVTLANGKVYIVAGDVDVSRIFISQNHQAKLVLLDGCNLCCPNGIMVIDGAVLTITAGNTSSTIAGTGSLYSQGVDKRPGIGGFATSGAEHHVGTVVINGGVIEAHGGESGAGIGGSEMYGGAGTIEINGGTVKAYGKGSGAGIGSAYMASGGSITINGGTVEAVGGDNGASGIGGGLSARVNTITITGGKITATAGGYGSNNSNNTGGAGIGCGRSDGKATIVISGGDITATGTGGGAGIGVGRNTSKNESASITLKHTQDTAKTMKVVASSYISGMQQIEGVDTYIHTVKIESAFACVETEQGLEDGDAVDMTAYEGKTIVPADFGVTIVTVPETLPDGITVTTDPSSESSITQGTDVAVKVNYDTDKDTAKNHALKSLTVTKASGAAVPLRSGDIFTMPAVSVTVTAEIAAVKVLNASGEAADPDQYLTAINGAETALSGGWYVLSRDLEWDNRVKIEGEVNLILMDGAELMAYQGILVPKGNTLNIYAGNWAAAEGETTIAGTGKLVATGGDNHAGIGGGSTADEYKLGTVNIHGGTIEATGGSGSAGIGGGGTTTGYESGTVTITNGTVTATGGIGGAGIGGGEGGDGVAPNSNDQIIISGGKVTATGGAYNGAQGGAGIGGGYKGVGNVYVSERFIINGTANVTATGAGNVAGIGGGESGYVENTDKVYVGEGGGIMILDSAVVVAYGAGYGAGIGGGGSVNAIVAGGAGGIGTGLCIGGNSQVTANGGEAGGAGIGGGGQGEDSGKSGGTGGAIQIADSARVTANGGAGGGAGIVGGRRGSGTSSQYSISIYGGTVTATGGAYAAGIGGGRGVVYVSPAGNTTQSDVSGGTINITNGTVTATGGTCAAGIGGGASETAGFTNGAGGKITVGDSSTLTLDVTAIDGAGGGAGIGGGLGSAGTANSITITKGTVKATGSGGAGIGGGAGGASGNITINGTANVTASGTKVTETTTPGGEGQDPVVETTSTGSGAGIGGGGVNGGSTGGAGGNITISGTANVTATGGVEGGAGIGVGVGAAGGTISVETSGSVNATGTTGAAIGGGAGYDASSGTVTVKNGTVRVAGGSTGVGIGLAATVKLTYAAATDALSVKQGEGNEAPFFTTLTLEKPFIARDGETGVNYRTAPSALTVLEGKELVPCPEYGISFSDSMPTLKLNVKIGENLYDIYQLSDLRAMPGEMVTIMPSKVGDQIKKPTLSVSWVTVNRNNDDATYSFAMPEQDVTVTVALMSAWDKLQDKIDYAADGETIELSADVKYDKDKDTKYLTVRTGKNVTIDLKGYSINRRLTEATEGTDYGYVIRVEIGATLTVKDTSENAAGTITGGYNKDHASTDSPDSRASSWPTPCPRPRLTSTAATSTPRASLPAGM